jgi:Plasmid recombination enzyme/Domain of unknown function (DUF3854)
MAYCICRIAKLKSGGAIAASEHHTRRTRDTPNADLSKENERFIGDLRVVPLEQEVFARIGQQKIRSDAVLCIEMMLSASPEYFRPDDHGRAGKWNSAQLEEWKQANYKWLSENYGDKIVRAELHLDESTPHIHAYFVPLDQNNKLNSKSYFGDRVKLRLFQDNYAEAMATLGLERGIKGSRATHTQVKDYYAAVTKEPDETLTSQEIQHQLADRQMVLKKNTDLERTSRSLALRIELLQHQIQSQQTELEQYKHDSSRWQDKYDALKSQLLEIPLSQDAHEIRSRLIDLVISIDSELRVRRIDLKAWNSMRFIQIDKNKDIEHGPFSRDIEGTIATISGANDKPQNPFIGIEIENDEDSNTDNNRRESSNSQPRGDIETILGSFIPIDQSDLVAVGRKQIADPTADQRYFGWGRSVDGQASRGWKSSIGSTRKAGNNDRSDRRNGIEESGSPEKTDLVASSTTAVAARLLELAYRKRFSQRLKEPFERLSEHLQELQQVKTLNATLQAEVQEQTTLFLNQRKQEVSGNTLGEGARFRTHTSNGIYLPIVPNAIAEGIYQRMGITPTIDEIQAGFWSVVHLYNLPIVIAEVANTWAFLSQGYATIGVTNGYDLYISRDMDGKLLPDRQLNPEIVVFATPERQITFALVSVQNRYIVCGIELFEAAGCDCKVATWTQIDRYTIETASPTEEVKRSHYRTQYEAIARKVLIAYPQASQEFIDTEVYFQAIVQGDSNDGVRFISEGDNARTLSPERIQAYIEGIRNNANDIRAPYLSPDPIIMAGVDLLMANHGKPQSHGGLIVDGEIWKFKHQDQNLTVREKETGAIVYLVRNGQVLNASGATKLRARFEQIRDEARQIVSSDTVTYSRRSC